MPEEELDLDTLRGQVMAELAPVKAAENPVKAVRDLDFTAKRTKSGRELPEHYLVYYLLVELLGFKDLGRSDKTAWTVPIEYKGNHFLIEHRKFGLGIFVDRDLEKEAADIVEAIKRATKVAQPYFEFVAKQAVQNSELNVENRSSELLDRYEFYLQGYQQKAAEAEKRSDEREVVTRQIETGHMTSCSYPATRLRVESKWIGISAIEAFFSWTEHAFIHMAILRSRVTKGEEVGQLALGPWDEKFKAAIDITDPVARKHYDALLVIKKQVRNFIAHGAFGRDGEAFKFHSKAGAVPVILPHQEGRNKYSLGTGMNFDIPVILAELNAFIAYIKSKYAPEYLYFQESGLPCILTMAQGTTYAEAIESEESMNALIEHLHYYFDMSLNMDW